MDKPRVTDATVYLVGQVVLEAQRLEDALKYLVLIWDVLEGRVADTESVQRRVEDRTFASTQLKRAREKGLISDEVERICNRALGERHRVVHRLIREGGSAWSTPAGRSGITKDVAGVRQLIVDATAELAKPLVDLGAALGLPTSDWEARSRGPAD